MFRIVFWDVLPYKRRSTIILHGSTSLKTILNVALMMEAVRTSETSIDNYCTRQYIPEDNSEHRPDDGGSTYLWNVGRQLFYTAVHPWRQFWTSPWWWWQYAPLKRRSTIILHGSTSLKTILNIALIEAARTSETSVDNYFTRQYIPEDNSEHRPDDGGSTYLWNVGRQLFYTAVHPRRQFWTSYSPPWELEISHVKIMFKH
jgi:hypothetical protein